MAKKKTDQRPMFKGALNELGAIRMQLKQAGVIVEEAMQNLDRLHDLLQVQLDRLEGKKRPKQYVKEVCISPYATMSSGGHAFGQSRPAQQGMNHTASSYCICLRCGLSDVYLDAIAAKFNGGIIPPCQS